MTGPALIALLYLAGVLVSAGRFTAIDEAILFDMTRAFAARGLLAAEAYRWANRPEVVVLGEDGPDGRLYTYFEPAQPILAAPILTAADWFASGGSVPAILLFNPAVFALTGWLIWQLGRSLGYSPGVTLAGTLAIACATPLWPYTKTFFREPLAGLALVATVLALVRARRGRDVWAAAAGLTFGFGLLVRTSNLLAAPAVGLLLLSVLATRPRWPDRARLSGAFAGTAALGVAGLLLYTWLRFGNPLYSPYQARYFGESLVTGLWGLLLSPGKGLFLYAPVLVLAVAGWPWLWRRDRWLAGAVALTGIAFVAFFARYVFWWGGFAWGPRFLVAAIPLLAVPIWAVFDRVAARRAVWPRVVVAAIVALSLLVQINAVSLRHGDYLFWLGQVRGEAQPEAGSLLTDWTASPVFAQWAWFSPDHSDLVWWRPDPAGSPIGRIAWLPVALGLAGIGLAGAGLAGRPRRLPATAWAAGLAIVCVAATAAMWTTGRAAPAAPDLGRVAAMIAGSGEGNDPVVTVLDHRTADFLNTVAARRPVLGLPLIAPVSDADARALDRHLAGAGRVWLVATGVTDADPRNGPGRWLADHAYPVRRTATDNLQVALFAAPPPAGLGAPLPGPASVEFGAGVRLVEVRANREPVRAGHPVAVETAWEVVGTVDRPYQLTAALVDAAGRVVATTNHEPRDGFVRWPEIPAGGRLTDRMGLDLPRDTPPGAYFVAIGVYDPVDDRRLPVAGGGTEARFGPIRITAPAPPNIGGDPIDAQLGDRVRLIAAEVPQRTIRAGDTLSVTLAWRADPPPERDLSVFVHLGPAGAPPVAQSDGPPGDGRLPATTWLPGETIIETRAIAVPAGVPPGEYDLRAGLYDPGTVERRPVQLTGGSRPADRAVPLGRVTVR